MTPPPHTRLHPQCEICLDSLEANEPVVAVYVEGSPFSYHLIGPFGFPKPEIETITARGLSICNDTECDACRDTPEAVPMHVDCYDIFMHKCPVKDKDTLHRRLWTLAVSRKPWRGASPLFLPKQLDVSMLQPAANWFGLPQLCGMSLELVDMIRGYSEHALLWRCISAFSLAAYMAETKEEPRVAQVAPLREIASWTRGGKFETALPSQTLPPVIRITIDCDGIYSIERLAERPQYSRECSVNLAYIVDPAHDFKLRDVVAQLLDGRLRLELPPGSPIPHIWNTPAPPTMTSCKLSDRRLSPRWPRFFAIETGRISGITFFYCQKYLHDIHIHRPGGPSVLSTFEKFSSSAQDFVVWVYMPISAGDRLAALGLREIKEHQFNVLVRMVKAGNVTIGPLPRRRDRWKDRSLGKAPMTLVRTEPQRVSGPSRVPWIGAFCPEPSNLLSETFPVDRPKPLRMSALPLTVFYSWAPLSGVASVVVFSDPETGFCKGIVLSYLNGGARAVGQCRLGLDPALKVEGPSVLCLKPGPRPPRPREPLSLVLARVKFGNGDVEHKHGDEQEPWQCHPMEGLIRMWSSFECSLLEVGTEEDDEAAAGS
ncbi:hypothetical protein TARUN_9919 [Trichoderma arundinaceum]|uniref:Uncharacterized protein n=1 Tax=Trichoderma arundinaceum TaxID=490622 RepID=A0A395N8Z4_TRIAR|nr:hypothetical protein TARUN_9919 [Trichoderma arundinaceum]